MEGESGTVVIRLRAAVLHCRSQGDGPRVARIVCPATHNREWRMLVRGFCAGSGSNALLRCPASASALERASRCMNRLPCDMANARLVSRAGSGSSALLRCPASASALGRASRLADRCAKNFSLFLPLAAVEILALHAAQCYAADDELREQQVDDDHGQDGDGDHHIHLAHIELQEVCTA